MKTKEQKALLKKCRHKAEIPVTIAAVILTVLSILLVVFLVSSLGKNQWAEEFLINNFEFEEADIQFALKCGKYLVIAIVAVLVLKLTWELFKNAGIAMVEDVPVAESDYPEIFKEYREWCEKLGIKKTPKLFLATDKENLESTGITIKSSRYLRMDLSALDVRDMVEDDNVVRFEIIHELAHIAYHHYSYPLLIATVVARWLPFVKNVYSRIMCYSADKLVSEMIGKEECITVLLENFMVSAYDSEQREEYVKRLDRKLNTTEKISAVLNNLTTDTPAYLYRLKAIADDRDGRVI